MKTTIQSTLSYIGTLSYYTPGLIIHTDYELKKPYPEDSMRTIESQTTSAVSYRKFECMNAGESIKVAVDPNNDNIEKVFGEPTIFEGDTDEEFFAYFREQANRFELIEMQCQIVLINMPENMPELQKRIIMQNLFAMRESINRAQYIPYVDGKYIGVHISDIGFLKE